MANQVGSKTYRLNYSIYSFAFAMYFDFVAYADADNETDALKSINPLAESVTVTLVEDRS